MSIFSIFCRRIALFFRKTEILMSLSSFLCSVQLTISPTRKAFLYARFLLLESSYSLSSHIDLNFCRLFALAALHGCKIAALREAYARSRSCVPAPVTDPKYQITKFLSNVSKSYWPGKTFQRAVRSTRMFTAPGVTQSAVPQTSLNYCKRRCRPCF